MRYRPTLQWLRLSVAVTAILLSNCKNAMLPGTPDTAPPATVTDLRATVLNAQSVRLDWTAPGDDVHSGRAAAYEIRYSTGVIDAEHFATASRVGGVPSPNDAGAAESLTVGGLDDRSLYSFALRAVDEDGNWSAISNVVASVSLDRSPPAQITDLTPSAITLRTVTLSWTATGDDGLEGTATRYLLRYATSPIVDWDTALPVPGADLSAPAAAGTRQAYVVTGLQPFQAYTFAIRAEDDAGNLSPVSNQAAASTTIPGDESELVEKLVWVYAQRDLNDYAGLFAAGFIYDLDETLFDGTTHWDLTEELRIHRRMFEPQSVQPPEVPVPSELLIVAIDAALTKRGAWSRAPQYYFDPVTNPTGLDPARWHVTATDYVASLFFHTQGERQYQVDGLAHFVVADDLSLPVGTAGKFTLYRWDDLGGQTGLRTALAASWSGVKELYR